jgi:transcriptional regulator with XRE-family HTH domain
MTTVPELIKATREAQKMTLEQFAEAIGATSKEVVHHWEKGKNGPSENLLALWLFDPRTWLSDLALDIYTAKYRAAMEAQRARLLEIVAA